MPQALLNLVSQLRDRYSPDPHLSVYIVTIRQEKGNFVLTGETDLPEAKAETLKLCQERGFNILDKIELLPAADLGSNVWAIAALSVVSGREEPDHKAEMGTQLLMGQSMRLLKHSKYWCYVQSADGYLSWVERGSITPCTRETLELWKNSPLLQIIALEAQILSEPRMDSEAVSDVVIGDLVKAGTESGDWVQVKLPDSRTGFIQKSNVQDFAGRRLAERTTPENIEATARLFLGRPYLWGGCSSKAVDCSGFVKLVFHLNGIELRRNASQQASQGEQLEIRPDFSNLRKGDLLFFGGKFGGNKTWITHVAIYLGNKEFIQASERVRLSSLDPHSPVFDERHSRTLLMARRLLPWPRS
jgi:cell wall-associated NlpC family hydrolase